MTAIDVEQLSKRVGDRSVVDDLTFAVEPGEIVGFLGPNGAGKTTTLRMLLGLATPTAGVARVLGRPYAALERPCGRVGSLLDAGGMHPGRTGRRHLDLAGRLAGVGGERTAEVLELVELAGVADDRIRTYSLGMRRRLALATALLGEPDVLVLDEPANGLDPGGIAWLRDLLRAQAADGRAVLLSSHALAEVAQTVDRVLVLVEGTLRADAPVAALGGQDGLEDAFLRLADDDAPERADDWHDLPAARREASPAAHAAPRRAPHAWPAGDAPPERHERALRGWPGVTAPATVAVAGPKGGVGRSTVSLLLADALASATRVRVAALDANPSGGTLCEHAGGTGDRDGLIELLAVAERLERAADLSGRALRTPAGTDVFGFAPGEVPCALGAPEYATLLDLLERFYEVVVCDLGPSTVDGVAAVVLGRAARTVVVSTPGAVARDATRDALGAADPATRVDVVNQSMEDLPGAVAIPADPRLAHRIEERSYRHDLLDPPVRAAALRLAVAVAGGLR